MSKAATGIIMAAGIALAAVGLVVAVTARGSLRTDFGAVDPGAPPDLRRIWRGLRWGTAGWGLVAAGAGVAVAAYVFRTRRRPAAPSQKPRTPPLPPTPPPLP